MPCLTCPYARLGVPTHCPGAGHPCRSLPVARTLRITCDGDAEVSIVPFDLIEAAMKTGLYKTVEGESPFGKWVAYSSTLPGMPLNRKATRLATALGLDVEEPPLHGDVAFFGPMMDDGHQGDVQPEVVDLVARLVEGDSL